MAGKPWERDWKNGGQPKAASQGKPWERNWSKGAQAYPAAADWLDKKLNLEQEMPSWLEWQDRAIVKNFANQPDSHAALQYLRQKYPAKEFSTSPDGIVAKEEGKWKTIDPNPNVFAEPGKFIKDIPQDMLDVAYDIPAGIAQGAATVGGTVLGAAGGPAGAVAGGVAASSASGAGLEAARQGIGQAFGIPQELDAGQIGMAGAVGAAAPLALGLGKPAQAVISKLMANGMSQEAATAAYQKLAKGGIERAYDWTAPRLGSVISGKSVNSIQNYAKNQDAVRSMEKNGVMGPAQNLSDTITNSLDAERNKLGQQVASAIEQSGQKVDIAGAKKAFQDRIAYLQSKPDLSQAEQAEINSLKAYYDKHFGLATPVEVPVNEYQTKMQTELPGQLDASRAFDLQKRLKQAAAFETGMTPETASAKGSARNAYGELNKSLSAASDSASQEAKDAYARQLGIEAEIGNSFSTPQKTYNTVVGLDKNGKRMLSERLQNFQNTGKLDVENQINQLRAYDEWALNRPDGFGVARAAKQERVPIAGFLGTGGAVAGHLIAGYPGMAVGGSAGLAAGGLLGGTAAIRKAIDLGTKLEATGAKYAPSLGYGMYANPAAAQSIPWALMPTNKLPEDQAR